MNELVFKVEFLSDIVLPATSNTEGNIEQLDFIPGSNFLGMVAREYAEFNDSFSVFHSGAVRFGDATLLLGNKAAYKMPLSFFHEKLDPDQIVNHHLVENFSEFKQLKQKRKGYITQDLDELEIKYNYAQKSAYDKEKRRSKDSSMYGYNAIASGTQWQFTVKYDGIDKQDAERIKKNLIGKKHLGKSKSSQYGLVEISEAQKVQSVECRLPKEDTTLLYVKSRLALIDEEGLPTYDLKYLIEGLDESSIDWKKSQIRTSTFTPYNGAMQTKCYERMVISSGSVIVLKDITDEQLKKLENGIGVYLSEGFGEVLVNPSFLEKKGKFTFTDAEEDKSVKALAVSDPMVKFLENRELGKKLQLDLATKVNSFMKNNKQLYKNISNSQWGTIRSICNSPADQFREEIRDYISDGKVTWSAEQIESLLEEGKSREFIKLLSMKMPKNRKEN